MFRIYDGNFRISIYFSRIVFVPEIEYILVDNPSLIDLFRDQFIENMDGPRYASSLLQSIRPSIRLPVHSDLSDFIE